MQSVPHVGTTGYDRRRDEGYPLRRRARSSLYYSATTPASTIDQYPISPDEAEICKRRGHVALSSDQD